MAKASVVAAGLWAAAFVLQLHGQIAFAQATVEIEAGHHFDAGFLAAAPNGTTSLLLLSQPDSTESLTPSKRPALLELLSFDAARTVTKRQRLEQALADAVGPKESAPCKASAAATRDGFVVFAPKAFEDGPQTTLASVFRLSPEGRVLSKLDLGHPAFAPPETRRREYLGLCANVVLPGPGDALLLAGSYVETLGSGPFHPWWALFDSTGHEVSPPGDKDVEGSIVAGRLGEDGIAWTVGEQGGNWATLMLRRHASTGPAVQPVRLLKSEFRSQALFTKNEIAVVSIEPKCVYPIRFFSLDGRRLRSARYVAAKNCDAPPGTGRPENPLADGDGLIATIDEGQRLARFNREGHVAWRSPPVEPLAVLRRDDGTILALAKAAKGLALHLYR